MASDMRERLAGPAALGRAARLDDAAGRYIEAAKASFPRGLRLDDLKIVVDCAHGAAYRVAPTVLWELGATVIPVGVAPDGFNINHGCGSTVPEYLCAKVVEHGADLGIALDGDADRLIMADETGRNHRRRPDPGADRTVLGGKRAAARRRHRRDRDVQSRAGALPRGPGALPAPHQGRRPLRGRADARDRHQCRRRAIRPRHPVRLRHHRATGCWPRFRCWR